MFRDLADFGFVRAVGYKPQMDVRAALEARKSVRAYRSDPVPAEALRQLFETTQRAASWCNIQPWRVWLFSGDARERFLDAMTAAAVTSAPDPDFNWPPEYPEPYAAHRRGCGRALYEAMGVARNDGAARQAAWMRNYRAFGAPHVAMVGVDKRIGVYGALDVGVWLGSLMLAAEELGLACCAQASLATHPSVVRAHASVPAEIGFLFGIAIGYEDKGDKANDCHTTRAPVEENVVMVG